MKESFIKENLTSVIELQNQIISLNDELVELKQLISAEERVIPIKEFGNKLDSLKKNRNRYEQIIKQIQTLEHERNKKEQLIIKEIPIFNQKVNIDLGPPHGMIMFYVEEFYAEDNPSLIYFHVSD
jgi:hypothetical protein